MRDDAGAPPVTPVGSRLGITPASTGGLATPPAPDHHVPAARSAAAPRADRLCAAHLAPGPDRPSDEPPRPPEQDRPRAASWAPDQHVPAAPTATAPGVDRLRAAHLAPGPDRPFDEPPRPPEQDRPRAASWAPDQHVPAAPTATAPGVDRLRAAHLAPGPAPQQDRPRAVQDPALASPDSHVTPPAPPAPDCSRRDATGTDPRPTSITDTPAPDLYSPAFTAQELQQLAHTDHGPPLAAEVRLLRVLILRLVTTPRRRRRRAGAAFQRRRRYARQNALHAVCRALDVLQRLLKTQLALAPSDSTELMQLLDEAAAHMAADQPPPSDLPDPSAPPAIHGASGLRAADPRTYPPIEPPGDLPADPSAPADPPMEPPAYAPLDPRTYPPIEPPGDLPADPSAPADPPMEPAAYAPLDPRTYPPIEPPTTPPPGGLSTSAPLSSPSTHPDNPTDLPPATPPPQYDRPPKYPHALLPPPPSDPPRTILHPRSLLSPHEYDP